MQTASASASQSQRVLPTSFSDLILPYQPTLSQTLTSLKKSRLSIHNRLISIAEDSKFVSLVSAANENLPLIANERCGSWYVDPSQKKGSVYFKSTDGHQGQWSFSLRRLNTSLLGTIGQNGGAIVVDSTRRGKTMPDALSKTVPIWVAVMNRILFPDRKTFHELCTPEDLVGRSEHAQIEARIAGFVKDVLALDLDLQRLKSLLSKPMRLDFVTRQTTMLKVHQDAKSHTLICCSASRPERGDGDTYVQGAGDDTENWAFGLTAQMYWQHKNQLLSQPNEEKISELIQLFSDNPQSTKTAWSQVWLKECRTSLFVGESSSASEASISNFDGVIFCDPQGLERPTTAKSKVGPFILQLQCPIGKFGGKTLREKLPLLDGFLTSLLKDHPAPKITILCSSGRDLSIGVTLAILCRWIDDDGTYRDQAFKNLDKNFVRKRLACISDIVPSANPSRATLQSVNAYLMGGGHVG